jgi:hypothetical protein
VSPVGREPKYKMKLIFPSLNRPDMSFPQKILLNLDVKRHLQYPSDVMYYEIQRNSGCLEAVKLKGAVVDPGF